MKQIAILFLVTFLFNAAFSQWKQNEFVIGTFADPRISVNNDIAKDSLSYVKARNAYINFLTGPQYYMGSRDFSMMDRTLKLAQKFNMQLLVIDSRMRIADSSFNADTAMKIISHFKSLNSKAFAGYYLIGEVPQKYVSQVNQWTAFFKKNDPGKLAYYYLLPYYAFNSKSSYEVYVNSLTSNPQTSSDVVSFDYYPFTKNGSVRNSFFYSLNYLSNAAGSRPFWSYILSTSNSNLPDPTQYQLNFSVFCSLAYGAKGIIYFTYEPIPSKNGGNFGDAILDANGNPTKKYTYIKAINEYVTKVLGPVIMNSTRIGTYHVSANSNNETIDKTQLLSSSSKGIETANMNILIGVFKSKNSAATYLLLVNKDSNSLNNVSFTVPENIAGTLKVYPRMGQLSSSVGPNILAGKFNSGKTTFTIDNFSPGEAILVTY